MPKPLAGVEVCEAHPVLSSHGLFAAPRERYDSLETAAALLADARSWTLAPSIAMGWMGADVVALTVPGSWVAPYSLSIVRQRERPLTRVIAALASALVETAAASALAPSTSGRAAAGGCRSQRRPGFRCASWSPTAGASRAVASGRWWSSTPAVEDGAGTVVVPPRHNSSRDDNGLEPDPIELIAPLRRVRRIGRIAARASHRGHTPHEVVRHRYEGCWSDGHDPPAPPRSPSDIHRARPARRRV